MGVAIGQILQKQEMELKDLAGKVIAIDAPLFLYQFLSSIRSPDGTPLQDSKGNVTSHLVGLFFRTISLMQKQIKLVFVFDGKPPELKQKERARRRELKQEAAKEYEIAKQREDVSSMKKYAQRMTKLDKNMINEAKELITAMGLPVVQAASEAEAQASYMVKKGDAYAVATQDSDTMMFGATRVIRNISLAGKRKRNKKLAYEVYKPELVLLSENMNNLGLDTDAFVMLCMLIGTDFNVGGIKGLGPKKSLALVKKYHDDPEALFKEVEWDKTFDYDWNEVFYLIKNMPVEENYVLEWNKPDPDKVKEILVARHEFSEDRVDSSLDKLKVEAVQQKGLNEFF